MTHVPLMFCKNCVNFLRRLSLHGKTLDDSSRFDFVEIARVALRVSFKPVLEERTCNLAQEQTPLSKVTIDSVSRHREVGRAKDLQHPTYT
jgi:hypothetical protein